MNQKSEDILFTSIHSISKKIKSGDVSPVELTQKSLERAEQLQPQLNAFLEIWHQEAIDQAKKAEAQITAGNYIGPMHGVPIALKDLVDVAGKPTTAASKVLQQNIATRDATITTRLKRSGAIIIGKTNLVEFAFGPTGLNPYTGDARNPWDVNRITGGSSSGSGVAVAAGITHAAIGSDTGGSIRMPASLCGIAGLKPTYGRVPRTGVLDLSWSQDHVGPMTRSAIDCGIMMNVISGYDRADIASSQHPVPDFTAGIDRGLDNLRIGIPQHYFFDLEIADRSVIQAVRKAIDLLERNGAEIVEIAMPWVSDGRPINVVISLAEAAAVHEKMINDHADDYTPAVRGRIHSAMGIAAIDYIRAQRARRTFAEKMAEATKGVDVLITPTVPKQTPTIAECTPRAGESVASGGADIPLFTSIFDVTGQPSLSVNCGFDSEGMPIGMMITGQPFDENTVLQVGHAYEELANWNKIQPQI